MARVDLTLSATGKIMGPIVVSLFFQRNRLGGPGRWFDAIGAAAV